MVQTILRRPDVERATGLPRSTIYEMMAKGRFPKPLRLGGERSIGWLESEILAWQKERIAERDQPASVRRRRAPRQTESKSPKAARRRGSSHAAV